MRPRLMEVYWVHILQHLRFYTPTVDTAFIEVVLSIFMMGSFMRAVIV